MDAMFVIKLGGGVVDAVILGLNEVKFCKFVAFCVVALCAPSVTNTTKIHLSFIATIFLCAQIFNQFFFTVS
jgi:hypothetical protein